LERQTDLPKRKKYIKHHQKACGTSGESEGVSVVEVGVAPKRRDGGVEVVPVGAGDDAAFEEANFKP